MTDATGSSGGGSTRPLALRVAAVHVRNGALGLARAELEASAGRGELDEAALLDLAEVRWRTGDLGGAGEAANAYLATGKRHPLAFVVAAEAMAALGRPSEARRLAASALGEAGDTLDAVFAGMPRTGFWPAESVPGGGLDDAPDRGAPAVGTHADPDVEAEPGTDGAPGARSAAAGAGAPPASLWDEPLRFEPGVLPDAATALEAGRAALTAGDVRAGTAHLAVALRLDPALAPAVLDATGVHRSAELDVLRGDAYRAVGREREARHAYAAALAATGVPAAEPATEHAERADDDGSARAGGSDRPDG